MADNKLSPKLAALRSLEASLHLHKCAEAARARVCGDRSDQAADPSLIPSDTRASGPASAPGAASLAISRSTSATAPRPRCTSSSTGAADSRPGRRPLGHRFVAGCAAFGVGATSSVRLAAEAALRHLLAFDLRGAAWHARRAVVYTCNRRATRVCVFATGVPVLLVGLVCGGLWWRLTLGPIPLDIATPWLTAAIAENLGNNYTVEVGGTVIELDEGRRMAVRIRDIVVKDQDGAVVATAPKAEAGFTAGTLLSGRPRAESINLVGAEIALRVETDGKVTVFAGADKRPIATSPVLAAAGSTPVGLRAEPTATGSTVDANGSAEPQRSAAENFAAVLAWIDSLGKLGLDGGALTEVGLKSGNLVVDDQRNGRQSRFENIHVSMTRPQPGELSVTLGSQDPERPWVVVGAVKTTPQGTRAVRVEARKVSVRDILMALRLDGGVESDLPISASLKAEIGADGVPSFASGRLLAGPGMIGEIGDALNRVSVDRLEANLEWDAARGMIVTPFQLVSGSTRMTLIGQAEPPSAAGKPWQLALRGGSVVLGSADEGEAPLLVNRVLIRGRFDPATRRLDIQHGEAGGGDVNVAMSGFVDLAGGDPRLVVGMAARNMSATSFKRIWPPFVNPPVREWVMDNMAGGTLDRIEIATNAPLSTLRAGGPPVPDDGLSIEIVTSGTQVKLMEALPPIRESDLVMRVRGRQIAVALGRGVAELPSGRRMTVTNGLFEVPDSHGPKPPAKVRARVDGPAPAAAEFLALDHIRESAGVPLDPATVRGTVSAQVMVSTRIESDPPPGTFNYTVAADVTNFGVDKFALSQKLEAQTLRVAATQQGYQVKGDVKVGGVPAAIEYKKAKGDEDAELRLTATLDDAARTKLGFDVGNVVAGAIPIKLSGRLASNPDQDNRLVVESDLGPARIDNLLPGWTKPPGKPAKAVFTYVGRGKAARFEDLSIDGAGVGVKGGVELDPNGDFLAASFPVFGLSDGDKATLKAERGADGMTKVTIRGDVFDGRGLVKSVMGGSGHDPKRQSPTMDLDVDAKIGALAGFNGEALRAIDLKLVRRGGKIDAFNLSAKIGADAALIGDLRGRVGGGGQVIYVDSKDAGALFRFTDVYPRMFGGQMWVAMDPPSPDQRPKEGVLNVRDFWVRGEASLDRVAASGAPGMQNPGVEFSRMRVEFSKSPGRLTLRDGVVRGPMVGATLEGALDFAANEVRMRGTFVPLYGLNNAFGQIPIVGLFLGGGDKEGLLGVTYEVVGTPGAPVLRVNPISAVAPGVLRKFFEFPSTLSSGDRGGATPDVRSAVQ